MASCENGNEPSDAIIGEKLIHRLRNYQRWRTLLHGVSWLLS